MPGVSDLSAVAALRAAVRRIAALALATASTIAAGQVVARPTAEVLGFERVADDGVPVGWRIDPASSAVVDRDVRHGGLRSLRIERGAAAFATSDEAAVATATAPVDFAGRTIELRGFLKAENLTGVNGLWIVEDDASGRSVAYDNMVARPVTGTMPWTEFAVAVGVHRDARSLRFGVRVAGTGRLWVDDLRLTVDGVPLGDLPSVARPPTGLETDHAFDGGSRIVIESLDERQVDALVLLGEVWGFLKYHDARVTSGVRQWDYELLRIVPAVLAARDAEAVRDVLATWIDALGPADACPCTAPVETGLALRPDLGWLSGTGPRLGARLLAIARDRPAGAEQFYLSLMPGAGNPSFDHEPDYRNVPLDDAGFRLLALYRFWNMAAYWFPYRDLLDEDWTATLRDVLPRIVLAGDAVAYQRELVALIARRKDTHANLWSSLAALPPTGACRVAADLRFVEDRRLVVTASDRDTGLSAGDEIVTIDGATTPSLLDAYAPYHAASNDAARLRDMARSITRGDCAPARLVVRDAHGQRAVDAPRTPPRGTATHELQGPTFRLLSDDVAYLKLSDIRAADLDGDFAAMAKTRGVVVDLRDYPSQFVVFALGNRLVDHVTPFATFTRPDAHNPGAFRWTPPVALNPVGPRYPGRVVVLVDEATQSQAEYTAMALRASPAAVVVGSTTAGADGNVSRIPLPGGLSAMFSGIGVFHPDGRPTQRIGIVPDVEARPTIAGIRRGRDEVLQAGVAQIVGPSAAAELMRLLDEPRRAPTSRTEPSSSRATR